MEENDQNGPIEYSDADIQRMETEQNSQQDSTVKWEPTTLTDADVARMERSAGNIPPPETIFNKVLSGLNTAKKTALSIPGVQPFLRFNEQAAAGGREFLRDIGGRETAYMRGYLHPEQSETFQHQLGGYAENLLNNPFIKNMSPYPQAAIKTAVQFPFQLAGMSADIENQPAISTTLGVTAPVIGKAIQGTGDIVKGMGNVITKSARLKYLDKIEDAVWQARKSASPAFKKHLDEIAAAKPNQSVDLSNEVKNIVNSRDPIVQHVLENSSELQDIVTHPNGGSAVPLQDAQKALNSITTQIPKGVLGGVGKRSMHIPIMDVVDDWKLAMSRDFPEIQGARDKYAQVVNDFKSIRPKVTGDAAERNLFANYNPFSPSGKAFMGGERSEEKFRRLVSPDVFREAIGTRHAKIAKNIGTAALVGVGEEAVRRSFSKR